jgi:hypothetical protein
MNLKTFAYHISRLMCESGRLLFYPCTGLAIEVYINKDTCWIGDWCGSRKDSVERYTKIVNQFLTLNNLGLK